MKLGIQFFYVYILFFCLPVCAEGFSADTLVATSALSAVPIKRVCDKTSSGKKQFVSSWHEKHGSWDKKRVRRVGRGTINCTVTLSFDTDRAHDIVCSPMQRFYLIDRHAWVAAGTLHPGDRLSTQSGHCVPLRDIVLNKQETVVYALRVKKNHTFCVGHYRLLTHNKRIPLLPLALIARIGVAFGTGAVAGGSTGSFFGPVTMAGGFTIGGLVGVVATCAAIGCELYHYRMQIGTHQLESIGSRQGAVYMHASQTIPPSSPGYADVNIPPPVEDSATQGGCGDMKPPEIIHSGGCGRIEFPVPINIGCGHPPTVIDDLPIGCGSMPSELANRCGIGCYPGQLVHSFAQVNRQADALTKTIEEILKDCSTGEQTRGRSEQFEKEGGFEEAQKDFEKLGVLGVHDIPNGFAGILSDGKKANVRTKSTAGFPTLEVYNPETRQSIKIRYNPN